jgi:hypothetical protein
MDGNVTGASGYASRQPVCRAGSRPPGRIPSTMVHTGKRPEGREISGADRRGQALWRAVPPIGKILLPLAFGSFDCPAPLRLFLERLVFKPDIQFRHSLAQILYQARPWPVQRSAPANQDVIETGFGVAIEKVVNRSPQSTFDTVPGNRISDFFAGGKSCSQSSLDPR